MPFTLDPCNSQWTCSEQELRDRFNLCYRSPTGRPRWLGPEFGSDADRQLQPHTAPRRERQWRLEAAVLPWFRPHDRVHPWAGGSVICTLCTSGFRRARHGTERGRQQAVLNTHPQGLARRARLSPVHLLWCSHRLVWARKPAGLVGRRTSQPCPAVDGSALNAGLAGGGCATL